MARDRTPLTEEAVASFLKAHPEWKRSGLFIEREFAFETFLTGIAFVQRVAALAEAADHHPDIDIRWRKVTLKLTTHDAGGLTFRDTALAEQADAAAKVG